MDKKTLQITRGALIAAIFAVLLFINRQTANIAEEFLVYAYPLPVMLYSAAYGLVPALPVFAVMIMISFLTVTPVSAIYALCYVFVGLIYGICQHRKAGSGITAVMVTASTVITNLIEFLLLSGLSGISFADEVLQYREIMTGIFSKFPVAVPDEMLSVGYLGRVLLICVGLFGIIQGLIITALGRLIYRRFSFTEDHIRN